MRPHDDGLLSRFAHLLCVRTVDARPALGALFAYATMSARNTWASSMAKPLPCQWRTPLSDANRFLSSRASALAPSGRKRVRPARSFYYTCYYGDEPTLWDDEARARKPHVLETRNRGRALSTCSAKRPSVQRLWTHFSVDPAGIQLVRGKALCLMVRQFGAAGPS